MDAIPLCLVGFGAIGPHVVGAANDSERVRLMGLCDLHDEAPSGLNCPQFTSLDAMVQSCKPRAVYIAVPSQDRVRVARDVLKHGISVIVENGGARSVQEFDQLTAYADSYNAHCYSAFHAAQAREMRWFRENRLRHIGRYGPIIEFDAHYSDDRITLMSVLLSIIPDLEYDTGTLFPCHFGEVGNGTVFTASNGRCHSEITLRFENDRQELLIDQSCERIAIKKPNGWYNLVGYWDAKLPITQHYVGVFEDYAQCVIAKKDNREFARRCLELAYH